MIAAYVREGIEGRESDLQKEAIRDWLLAEQIDVGSVTWYEDSLTDWKSTKSAFDALSRDIQSGKVSKVLVWKLDRLLRSVQDGVSVLSDWCNRGVCHFLLLSK